MNQSSNSSAFRGIIRLFLFALTFLIAHSLYADEAILWEWDDEAFPFEQELFHHGNSDQKENEIFKANIYIDGQNKIAVESWQLMKNQFGVQLYLGKVKGTNVRAFKGVVTIKSSINSILAVMVDANACTDWVHDCSTSYLVQDKGIRNRYVFQSYDLMFPAGKRDYLFYASVNQNPITQSVSINMEAAPDFCKQSPNPRCAAIKKSDNIMIQQSTGSYLLEPMPDGSTRVTWEQFTDPAGNLPVFIVNQLVLNVPFMTLKGLKEIVSDEKYQLADNILEDDFILSGNIGE